MPVDHPFILRIGLYCQLDRSACVRVWCGAREEEMRGEFEKASGKMRDKELLRGREYSLLDSRGLRGKEVCE